MHPSPLKKVTLMFESQTDLQKFEILIDFEHLEVNLTKLTITMQWDDAKIELAINAFNAAIFEVEDGS